jgi:peroxin-6
LPFLSVKGPELLGSYVGESEAQIRSTFQRARNVAEHNQPRACVLFFDELDSLAPRRGEQASGGNVMDRVASTLFGELDRHHSATVFCIGATNRPDLLDPALLRPGRLDRLVYLGIAPTDYANILVAHLRKVRLGADAHDLAIRVACDLPLNLTGADLASIVSTALKHATERLCKVVDSDVLRQHSLINSENVEEVLLGWDTERLEPIVTYDDLEVAAHEIVPSVSAAALEKYEQLRQMYKLPPAV